ncbi:ATP-binding cassette domain-containing protein [Serinibacter salmoneus]|uniref:ATP-binding cassette domain-containing protein n=1 Tax=Serinibacter salmoneus TaxID=556530 RepID=UPI000BF8B20D
MDPAGSGPRLIARGLSFAYPDHPVLTRVDLVVAERARIGVVGENGSGKSTLLRLLAGALEADSGTVQRRGSVVTVAQELPVAGGETLGDALAASLRRAREAATAMTTALERLTDPTAASRSGQASTSREASDAVERYEALRAWDVDRELDEALTRFGAPRDRERPLAQMSVGQRYRVRLACALAERSDVLLLDEPTNHLDDAAIEHLTARLAQWPGAVVLVTHDRALLDDAVETILDLDPTMEGPPARYGALRYADYRAAKDAAVERWRARYAAEQRRMAQLYWTRDATYEGLSDEWRPEKGSRKHRRATRARQHVKAADKRMEQLAARAAAVPPPPTDVTWPDLQARPTVHDGDALLLPGAHVPGRLERADLMVAVPPGGRLVVNGPNGAGKSTLLGLLAGAATSPALRVGVLWQESRRDERGEETGFDLAARTALTLLEERRLNPREVLPVAETGLVSEEDLDRPVRELSVGLRRRLDLALVLAAMPHVLLLDEPTNHLAVDLVDSLTFWLRRTEAAVVIATHDRVMRADFADWPQLDLV